MLLAKLRSSLGPVPNYTLLVPGNEDGGPHHMQGRHTRDMGDWFKKASGTEFEYSSNINRGFFFPFFLYTYV